MGNVREVLQEAFEAVKGTMGDTMESMKGTVGETVEAVKQVDFKGLLERHPWLYIGGFVAVGYFAYRLLEQAQPAGGPPPATSTGPEPHHGNGRHREEAAQTPEAAGTRSQDWNEMMAELKALAIGVPLSIIRDKIASTGAEAFRAQVTELVNALTEKLGGKVVQDRGQFAS